MADHLAEATVQSGTEMNVFFQRTVNAKNIGIRKNLRIEHRDLSADDHQVSFPHLRLSRSASGKRVVLGAVAQEKWILWVEAQSFENAVRQQVVVVRRSRLCG